MALSATFLERDLVGVETHEAEIGTVVDVTLPDGQSVVKAVRRGQSASLGMELAGYSDKRQDEITVRASQFDGLTVQAPVATDVVTISEKAWTVDSAECPDNTIWIFKISQA